jgi:hypothetical protein
VALTRDFRQTVVERVNRDPAFAQALLDEAATLFLNGDPETARLILRDLVNATIGFEQLAAMTDKPSKSLHRMQSEHGQPCGHLPCHARMPERESRGALGRHLGLLAHDVLTHVRTPD